jgi:Rrf2 family protein
MLKITRQTDYAVMILTRFAQEGPARIHNARDLSEETEVPPPMASKILKILAREGLLISQRGVKGGYRLARPASQVTIGEVIRAIEGPVAITDKESWCPVRSNWQRINDAVEAAVEAISLEEMARPLDLFGAAATRAGGSPRVPGRSAATSASRKTPARSSRRGAGERGVTR